MCEISLSHHPMHRLYCTRPLDLVSGRGDHYAGSLPPSKEQVPSQVTAHFAASVSSEFLSYILREARVPGHRVPYRFSSLCSPVPHGARSKRPSVNAPHRELCPLPHM